MPARTSEQYISPPKYDFCKDSDIENGCTCAISGNELRCGAIENCRKSKGKCHVVLAPPGDPRLLMPKHDAHLDGQETASVDVPPGWEAFCACLTYTGETPEESKTGPKPTDWTAPAGTKLVKKHKPCGPPIKRPDGDWICEGDDCTLVGVKKKGETQLVKLADPGGAIKPTAADGYWAIFCTHLEKA